MSVAADPAQSARAERHARKLRIRRAVVVALAGALTVWLAAAAQSPTSGPIERIIMMLIVVLVPLHVLFWQLEGVKFLGRKTLPKPVRIAIAYAALASSPLALYPLGLLAIVASLATGGGAAAPALATGGLILLSPIILLFAIALMFILSGYKGG